MTLPKIVYDLKLIIHNGHIPDDTRFDDRQLVYWINTQRSLWLTNEYNKKREIRNNEKQLLRNVPMSIVDSNEITTVSSGVKLLRTTAKLPRTLNGQYRDMIISIKPLNIINVPFNYVTVEQASYCGEGVLNANMLYFFKYNDYIYCKYGKQTLKIPILERVTIEGVFENPLDVDEFNSDYDYLWKGTTEYPISAKFIDYIKAEILKLNVGIFMQMPIDNNNDDEN